MSCSTSHQSLPEGPTEDLRLRSSRTHVAKTVSLTLSLYKPLLVDAGLISDSASLETQACALKLDTQSPRRTTHHHVGSQETWVFIQACHLRVCSFCHATWWARCVM